LRSASLDDEVGRHRADRQVAQVHEAEELGQEGLAELDFPLMPPDRQSQAGAQHHEDRPRRPRLRSARDGVSDRPLAAPALQAATRQGRPSAWSARRYVPRESSQNFAANRSCNSSARRRSSPAPAASPSASAIAAPSSRAAYTYPCTSHSAIGGAASSPR